MAIPVFKRGRAGRTIGEIAGAAVLFCMLLSSCAENDLALASRSSGPGVMIGGVAGFPDLSTPSATATLRKQYHVGLYIHDYAWERSDVALRRRILTIFGQPDDVEFGLMPGAKRWFATIYRTDYVALGVVPAAAHVNGLRPDRAAEWVEFVQSARAAGFSSVAPVMSPNTNQYQRFPFSSPHWDYLRTAATVGGGLTTDAPSRFFLEQKPGYREFVVAELRWARQHRLHTGFIVSPGAAGPSFQADTSHVVEMLQKRDALPDEFIVENYEPRPAIGYPNVIGDEQRPNTVAGVALSLVRQLQMLGY